MSEWSAILGSFVMFLTVLGGYLTHLIWSITTLASSEVTVTAGQAVLAGVGLILPFVGVVHGWLIWFGLGA